MSALIQVIMNGLIAGSIYALVAAGFSIIYSTNKFIHFAHGAVIAFAAYMLYASFTLMDLPFSVGIICTLILTALLGWLLYKLVYRPLLKKKASMVILLIASLGLLILIENMLQAVFGADIKTINAFTITKGWTIAGAIITPLQVVIMAVALLTLVVVYIVMQKKKLGRHMRAVADNKELASIVGINEQKIAAYSFILGSLLAAVAGILIGLEQNLRPTMGTGLIIKGYTGAIIGSVSSVPGAVLGSFLLGIVENVGILWLPSGYKDAIAFILLFIFLLWRPQGILGIKKGVKHA
ncbi:MAG TPA: branched-chain amino acid ABC transporter permease [Candidatus Nanoarchaeia archaeon]|nr:branched-chain amino acid ABC transporter permease [Candidatus Nanoarchaeia archaeon]